jgi:integrase
VDPFTGEELRAILTAAEKISPDFATLVRLWAQSGLRAGEVAALQEQDLDPTRGTVTVRRTYTRERLTPPKTGRTRTVSILHPLCEDTADWRPGATPEARGLLARLKRLSVRSLEPTGFLFGGPAPLATSVVNALWRRVLRAAGVRYRSPEQLRHTFASTLLSRNAPLLYVQQQGGWRSAAVLLSVYARWLPQAFEDRPGAHLTAPQVHPETAASEETPLRTGTYSTGRHFQK